VTLSLRRFCFRVSSPQGQNGFAGSFKNFVGTAARETASRTREDDESGQNCRHITGDQCRRQAGLDRIPGKPGSDEGESQQAGAEQGHPTGSQGKEAVGNEISISHDTPSDLMLVRIY
jgi:hypothetical protein